MCVASFACGTRTQSPFRSAAIALLWTAFIALLVYLLWWLITWLAIVLPYSFNAWLTRASALLYHLSRTASSWLATALSACTGALGSTQELFTGFAASLSALSWRHAPSHTAATPRPAHTRTAAVVTPLPTLAPTPVAAAVSDSLLEEHVR